MSTLGQHMKKDDILYCKEGFYIGMNTYTKGRFYKIGSIYRSDGVKISKFNGFLTDEVQIGPALLCEIKSDGTGPCLNLDYERIINSFITLSEYRQEQINKILQ
jgi:hypothetical protein